MDAKRGRDWTRFDSIVAPASRLTLSSRIKSPMPDEKPITDPEKIAAYVRSARIVYGFDDGRLDPGEIDKPPAVVKTPEKSRIRPSGRTEGRARAASQPWIRLLLIRES